MIIDYMPDLSRVNEIAAQEAREAAAEMEELHQLDAEIERLRSINDALLDACKAQAELIEELNNLFAGDWAGEWDAVQYMAEAAITKAG